MYAIKMQGFGNPDIEIFRNEGKLVGKCKSWFEVLESTHLKRAKSLEDEYKKSGFNGSKLSPRQLTQLNHIVKHLNVLRKKVENMRSSLVIGQGKLIHKDIHAEHIFIGATKVTGIIDFNNASSGNPIYDIATFSLMEGGDLYPHLLRGCRVEFDLDLFRLYRLLHSVGKIHFRYKEGYLHMAPGVLDIALEELNRQ